MSYTERIHWGTLAIAVIGAVLYIPSALDATSVGDLVGPLVVTTLSALVLIIAYSVTIAVRMAKREGAPLADQRDDDVERSATGWSFAILATGVGVTMGELLVRNAQDLAPNPLVTFHLLLAALFVAVCGGSIATLIRYRVGLR